MSLVVHTLPALKDNFIYILSQSGEAAVIDPGDAAPVERFLAEHHLHLSHILCTHHHADHIGGVTALKEKFDPAIWCSQTDFARVPGATHAVTEQEVLFGDPVQVLFVPGHTQGQVAYYLPRENSVFVGDTLFSAGCGRLFEGTAAQMFASLQKLRALPPTTKIYFGHEYTLRNLEFVTHHQAAAFNELESYRKSCEQRLARGQATSPTTVQIEMKINPFFNASNAEQFAYWREQRNHW